MPQRRTRLSGPEKIAIVKQYLRGFLADRPHAVAALASVFLGKIERLLCEAAGAICGDEAQAAPATPGRRLLPATTSRTASTNSRSSPRRFHSRARLNRAISRFLNRCATGGLLAGGCIPRIVYGRSLASSTLRSAHDRFRRRVSRAAPPPASCRPRAGTPLRASPSREDPASQDRVGEPRELARVARSRRAARAGIRRRGTPRLSPVRAALLRIRPRPVHGLRPGPRRRVLLQGTGRLPLL